MEVLVILLGLVLLDLAALRWGADSRDDLLSPEWQARREWRVGVRR